MFGALSRRARTLVVASTLAALVAGGVSAASAADTGGANYYLSAAGADVTITKDGQPLPVNTGIRHGAWWYFIGTNWLWNSACDNATCTYSYPVEVPAGTYDASVQFAFFVDNVASVYVDGTLIGTGSSFGPNYTWLGTAVSPGTHVVSIDVTDFGGPSGLDFYSWTQWTNDGTGPVVTTSGNITTEATSADGAAVTYDDATAADAREGALPASCSPASGSTFAIGTTTVTCSAVDSKGNVGEASFTVTVEDTTAPAVTAPASVTTGATSSAGAAVTYGAATATDIVDGDVAASCSPASGSTFAAGTATVTCSATDAAGNTGESSFSVTVVGIADQLAALQASVTGVGPGSSLRDKVATASAAYGSGDGAGAVSALNALLKEVKAQTGKKLTAAQASSITAATNAAIAAITAG